jgi:glycosyltransferase involved in cell wall biosynthesis
LRGKKGSMKKPKIASILSVLMVSTYPPNRDGIASYTARLENALRNENVTIRIAASGRDWKKNSLTYIFSIIRLAITSSSNIVHFQLSYFTFGNEYYTGFFPFLSVSLKVIGKEVVITFHDIVQRSQVKDTFLKNHTSSRFLNYKRLALNYYTKIVCLISDRVIVHSEIAGKVLAQDYAVPQKRIIIIPHGIDQETPASIKKRFENKSLQSQDRLIVTYFGLVKHGKGLEDLIKAWKKVGRVGAQLLIIGDKHPAQKDNYYEKLANFVRESGLESSIHFCGFVPEDILPSYLDKSDAFVLPYNEWGDVIASSGALSVVAPYLKPIIVTDVPAFQNLKKQKAALIVKKGDTDGLSSAIIKALTDAETRNSLEDNLKKWLPESSWLVVGKKTAKLYKEIE